MDFQQILESALGYEVIGLVALLLVAGFLLLKYFNDSERESGSIHSAFRMFMYASTLCVLIAALSQAGVFRSFVEPSGDQHLIDICEEAKRAHVSDGGDIEEMAGPWEVTWYMNDAEAGERKRYQVPGPEGELVDYPSEIAAVSVNGSAFFCKVKDATIDKAYWMMGRSTNERVLTMTYWSAPGIGSELAGVVIGEWNPYRGVIEAEWHGRTRDGKTTSGTVTWTKVLD